jgi:hypothetical protein
MLTMRRFVLFSLAMVAVLCCLNKALAANPEAPRLEMRETSFDFQDALEGDKVSHDFVVKNSGNAVLSINQVRPG